MNTVTRGCIILHAVDKNISELLPMLRAFGKFASNKYDLYPGDIQARTTLQFLASSHLLLVAKIEGKTVGCFAGLIHPHFFNPTVRVLTELFWWVEPEYRGTRAGLALLESATDWAKRNVDMFVMTLEHNSPVNTKTLEKRGFELRENNYILEV